jgi:hypothetical protein
MILPEALTRVTSALDTTHIDYMLTGSFASVFYGLPRSTQDIDLVISATPQQLRDFVGSLPTAAYYADIDAALEAHRRESLFNVIDLKTGWKIDLIIRKSRAFSHEEFARRKKINIDKTALFVASAEDVVVAKLEWSKLSQSKRQIEDAAGILRMQWDALDRPYLQKWTRDLALETQWKDAMIVAKLLQTDDTLP